MSGSLVLDRRATTRIRLAVDQLCNNLSEPEDVVKDFREEMITNITASVEELIQLGNTPEKAVEIAIQRFGDSSSVLSDVSQMFRTHRIFAKWLLVVTIVFGIIGGLCVTFNSVVNRRIVPYYGRQITSAIGKMVSEQNFTSTIPVSFEEGVQKFVRKTPYVTGVGMSIIRNNTPPNTAPFQYVYPSYLKQIEANGIFLPFLNNSLFTSLAPTASAYYQLGTSGNNLYVEIVGIHSSYKIATIGLAMLLLYWGLFSVWGITNMLYNRKFRILWGLSIVLFNVIGYLSYVLYIKYRRFKL